MLIRDRHHFEWSFPEAVRYQEAAKIRYDLFAALHELKSTASDERRIWLRSRIRELRQAPAAKEPWFLDMLANEHGGIASNLLVLLEGIP